MEKILIIAAIIFFAAVIIKNIIPKKSDNGKNEDRPVSPIEIKIPEIFSNNKDGNKLNNGRGKNGQTIRLSEWIVYVLDKDGNVLTEKEMSATCEKPFSIGYDKDCNLVVKSDFVSNVHLNIGKDDQGYFAKDCSLNGTYVNDKKYNNESFSLEEGLIYVADVPVYFKRNANIRPNVIPRFIKDNVEETNRTQKFDGFTSTKVWKKDAEDSNNKRPLTR